jgi:phosphoserine phosphatase RsbU/P
VVAADCTGHGVSGALMSMLGMSLLNQIVNERKIVSPSLILDHLHQAVVEALNQSENNSNEGMDIAVCKFNNDKTKVEFAGANRPLWLVRNEEIFVHQPDKVPIGGMQMGTRQPFLNHVIEIQKSDRIFLFTDGFADQFGGENGKKFMTKNLKDALISTSQLPIAEQKKQLQSLFQVWKGSLEQVDDVLLMGLVV